MSRRPSSRQQSASAEEGAGPRSGPGAGRGPAVALLLGAGLLVVTLSVVLGGPSTRLDDLVLAATPGAGGGPAVPEVLAQVVVDIATPALCVALVAALAAALSLWWSRWEPLLLAGPALALLTFTVLFGKGFIDRAAPGFSDVVGGSGSYPSGHTATALVCAGVVAELVSRLRPTRRTLAWALAAAWTLLVAASLVWLHYHWLSDVVGSIFLGSLLLWLLLRWPLQLGARVAAHGRHGGPSAAR